MKFDLYGIDGEDPIKKYGTRRLALLDANDDIIDYPCVWDTTTGEVKRYITDGRGNVKRDANGNPKTVEETYPAPLKIVDLDDFLHVYYEEGVHSDNLTGCVCPTHDLMWGGCKCGWLEKERAANGANGSDI